MNCKLAPGLSAGHSSSTRMNPEYRWVVLVMLSLMTNTPALRSAPGPSAEPQYAGHPLSYWVLVERRHYDVLSSHMDMDLDEPAKAAVRHAGTNAIPFLLEWVISGQGLRPAWAFGALGPVAQPAIPELTRIATSSERGVMNNAVYALGQIGPTAIPALSFLATNRTFQRRTRAVLALQNMGTNAIGAVPVLIECLRDEDSEVVSLALSTLRSLPARQQAVLAAERALLTNSNAGLRRFALMALAVFGEQALPDLVPALRDPDGNVGYTALEMLVEIAPQTLTNAALVAQAANGLGSPERSRRRLAAQMLRAADQWAQGRQPDLAPPIPGGWDRVLSDATNALLRLAPELLPRAPQGPQPPPQGPG